MNNPYVTKTPYGVVYGTPYVTQGPYGPIFGTPPNDGSQRWQELYGKKPRAYKKGGIVKQTELAKVHKGELVVPQNLVKYVSKTLKDKIKKGGGNI